MWASFTRVRLDPSRREDAIGLVRDRLVPEFLGRPGSMHGYWMLERTSGTGFVVTCWADVDSLEAARASNGAVRTQALDEIDALLCETGTYAVHGLTGAPAPIHGGQVWSRVTFVEGLEPARLDDEQELYTTTYAASAGRPGFRSLCWLVDPTTGNGMSISTWDTEEDLGASEPHSRRLRRRNARALGCRIESVVDVETIGATGAGGEDVLDLRDGIVMAPPAAEVDLPD